MVKEIVTVLGVIRVVTVIIRVSLGLGYQGYHKLDVHLKTKKGLI